ncbi:MAG: putative transposase [Gemmataceae bacterium]|nr:putative transposase [Gemmataceae bacterium]
MLGSREPGAVTADEGYDSDAFAAEVAGRGAAVMILPRKKRTAKREYDPVLYKERNKAERGIGLLKQFRRVAARYEKTAKNFLGMVLFAAITIWLR